MRGMTSPPAFRVHRQAYSRPPSERVMTPRMWWMFKCHDDAPRSPKAAKPTPKRVATTPCAAVTAGLATKAVPVRPTTPTNAEDNGVVLMDVHRATLFENSPWNNRSSGGLPLRLQYLGDRPRPPLEIGYRIAASSRCVVRLVTGFVWHVR